MFRAIAKKRIDFIVAALLPACILVGGFLIFQSIAGDDNETFYPTACGQGTPKYYRNNFGAEAPFSDGYCPGYQTYSTTENAYFIDDDNDHWNWHREQDWHFAWSMQWGTNACYVTLDKTDFLVNPDFGSSTNPGTGFWNGIESKWRDGDEVKGTSNTYKWFYKVVNGTNYRCPKYRLYRTEAVFYYCAFPPHEGGGGIVIQDKYGEPDNPGDDGMTYPGNSLVSTEATSGLTYNCVAF